ncbi:hypothetical protein [Streptomyces collinus]|uniref:hypothetical protein n=1 Tax=Streptomyces collinus TaxID=42684 RepID=UPI003626E456
MPDSFAAKYAPLIDVIKAAREEGDERAGGLARQALLAAYARLGNRLEGTVDEQNAYIVARRLGALPEALVDLGVREEDLPMPSRGRPSPPPAPPASAAAAHENVAERFAHIGGPTDEGPPERFGVVYRPEDNVRLKGRLQPFAVVDTEDGLPVSWYDNRDDAETIAGTASRLRA